MKKIIIITVLFFGTVFANTSDINAKKVSYTNGFGITVTCDTSPGGCAWDGHSYSNPQYTY